MARIFLIFPPSLYRNFTPPLNLAYIAAALEQDDHEVRVLDLSALNSPCDFQGAMDEIKAFNPLWIGLTLNVIFIRPAYEFISELRKLGHPIVVGGPHPSLLWDEALNNGCDIVVRGEGEETVRALTTALASESPLHDVPGISFRDETGNNHHSPPQKLITDLDNLPLPAKHLFPKEWYTEDSETYQVYGPIFSGRGCPAACSYCYKGVFGSGCRMRSAENVFQEMLELHDTFGVTAFEFMDDAFSADLKRVHKLCDLILDRDNFDPVWQCTTRMDLTDPDLLVKMQKAGCFRIFYGVESGDLDTLYRVNKHLDLDQAYKVLEWTRSAGIKSIVGFMWGFPWDSPSSVRASINYLKKIAPFTDEFNPLGILIPVPGTALYEKYAARFNLENWWMKDKFGMIYRSNQYFPYYQRRFYNDFSLLKDGFFPYPVSVRKMIKKGINFIGRHNLFNNSHPVRAGMVYAAVLLSKLLFAISPGAEKTFFEFMDHLRVKL